MKAIWESLLLRGKQADQLTLDFADATSESLADQVEVQWTTFGAGAPVRRPPLPPPSGAHPGRRRIDGVFGPVELGFCRRRLDQATQPNPKRAKLHPKRFALEAGAARRPARSSAW